MNSTTVSTWEVMEANSFFGIGYFERTGRMRSGKNAIKSMVLSLEKDLDLHARREVGSLNNEVSPSCTYVSTWSRTRVPPCLSEQVTYLYISKNTTQQKNTRST